ncbi:pentatricopeptide repeat-containing protein At1g08070, chloroplastic [Eucalyptus grandis]|nr:pentatricopeptide repeat-containing protein At1g08070, chloroplastic [Eucalyptus grandis]
MDRDLMKLMRSVKHPSHLKQIHALVIAAFPSLASFLVRRLLSVPMVDYAREVFDRIPQPEQSLSNSLISVYSRLSSHEEAIEAFRSMIRNGVCIDSYTVPPIVKSCLSVADFDLGKQVHCLAISCGLDTDVFVQTALMNFYSRGGELASAERIFEKMDTKDPIAYNCLISAYSKSGDVLAARKMFDEMPEKSTASWNSLISCYARNGDYREALRFFERMKDDKCTPNEITLASVLSICAKLGDLNAGLSAKKFIDGNNLYRNTILSTAVVEMYLKCGAVGEARREFDKMKKRDVVTWSAMIAGYAQNGRPDEALELFENMKNENIKPNDVALVSVLSVCADSGSVKACEEIGCYVESQGMASNVFVASALLDMYSKCGNISKSRQIFLNMPKKDTVTWNSMIVGLAMNGLSEDAFAVYKQMIETGGQPNDITFIGLLAACSHAGLVEMGLEIFGHMKIDHEIVPQIEHYACIVDLYCRSGRLKDAYDFICRMEVEPNAVIWSSLLSASRIHMNIELAELSVKKLAKLDPDSSWYYVLLSNIYSSTGHWKEALNVQKMMKGKKVQKVAAYSWVDVDNKLHRFLVGDTSHPRNTEVYGTVNGLAMQSTWVDHDFDSGLGL